MMKIYTKTGDQGETGLWGGQRVAKDHRRVQAYGTVDECNAAIGLARAFLSNSDLDSVLATVQNQLFVVGSELSDPERGAHIPHISEAHIQWLETTIDRLETTLPPLTQFILPGGSAASAHLHLSRTICRRAERAVYTLSQNEKISSDLLKYLNRLSDFLFVIARTANQAAGIKDIPWEQ